MLGPKEAATRLVKPTRIAGLDKVVEIAMGSSTYCARLADRSVTCWGRLRSGERRTMELGGPVQSIAIAGSNLLAVLDTGSAVTAWIEDAGKPAPIPLPQPLSLSCATYHCCALDQNHRAVCWGSNGNGQLGNRIRASAVRARPRAPCGYRASEASDVSEARRARDRRWIARATPGLRRDVGSVLAGSSEPFGFVAPPAS